MKEIVNAVHPTDVYSFFVGYDLIHALEEGTIKCHSCGVTITLENFRAVTRRSGNLLFACTQECCYILLIERDDESAATSASTTDVRAESRAGAQHS
jgi:hypothetical protein